MHQSGRKFTEKDLARETGYSHDYVRKMKSLYDQEHGLRED